MPKGLTGEAQMNDGDVGTSFLAQAGRVLGSSLDYRRTLQGLTELGLGVLGQVCLVGLLDGLGRLRIVVGAHLDRARGPVLHALLDVPHCSDTPAAVRSGRARVLRAMDDRSDS